MYCISRMKENRFLSMGTVKIFNKMQCHFHDKHPKQIRHTGNTLYNIVRPIIKVNSLYTLWKKYEIFLFTMWSKTKLSMYTAFNKYSSRSLSHCQEEREIKND